MRKIKISHLLLLVVFICNNYNAIAQNMVLEPSNDLRKQMIKDHTDIFVSTYRDGQPIGSIHDDSNQTFYPLSNRFFIFDQAIYNYIEVAETYPMQKGVGYVLQIRGGGFNNLLGPQERIEIFLGGALNDGNISVPMLANKFGLLGNPYKDFLDLDSFLLDPVNINNITGTIYLWSHNTIISQSNINTFTPELYNFSGNDYSMYNLLGGVAAGRSISSSIENGSYTGIQIPNGRICYGTGFGVIGSNTTSTGQVNFNNNMRTSDNRGETQSYRTENNLAPIIVTPPTRNRIWVNMEKGQIPTSGINVNPLKQLLIGYSACYGTVCATSGATDKVFDATTVTVENAPAIDFYSLASGSTSHLAIQGRNALTTFNTNDYFQLGYKVTNPGIYTFTASADGIFNNGSGSQVYYLQDLSLPTGSNIFNFPYEATIANTTADMINETRFRIVFKAPFTLQLNGICGNTNISNPDSSFYSTPIHPASPAIDSLQWEFVNIQTGQVGYAISTYPNITSMNMMNINNFSPTVPNYFYTYNTTYTVRIRVKYLGSSVYQPYGPICQLQTPPQVITNRSGSIVNNCGGILPINYQVVCTQASLYNYRWRVTRSDGEVRNFDSIYLTTQNKFQNFFIFNGGTGNTSTFPVGSLSSGFIMPNTSYCVEEAIIYDPFNTTPSNIGTYSNQCCFTTPSFRLSSFAKDFNVTAYPNPFQSNFTLEIQTPIDGSIQIDVFDMIGKHIESRNLDSINNVSFQFGDNYASGIYNIVVTQGEEKQNLKIIKK